jgi:hypothetical protein
MIVHPNVPRGPLLFLENQDSRGLLSASASASRFSSLHRQDKPLGQWEMRLLHVCRGGLVQDLRTASMLPAREKPSPMRWPAHARQDEPVCAAALPSQLTA